MKEQSVGNIGACTFCSVKMFGSGAYTDEKTGEIVRFDYVPEEDRDKFCKEHCDKLCAQIQRKFEKEYPPEIYCVNNAFDKAVEKEILRILKEGKE
jgi:hypothetical protein